MGKARILLFGKEIRQWWTQWPISNFFIFYFYFLSRSIIILSYFDLLSITITEYKKHSNQFGFFVIVISVV